MMSVLLTGADGMIGSHLKKYLRGEGYNVIEFEGDVCDPDNWKRYTKTDYLIHLAAFAGVRLSVEKPQVFYHNNVFGMKNAIKYVKRTKTKFLYASSSNAKEWWSNPYATTKIMNELQAEELEWSVGMRFHTVWPGRDDMLYKMLERKEVTYINGNHYRDFIHVDDLCSGILTIMDNYGKVDRIVDIGTGHATPVLEVAKKFGFDGEVRYTPTPHERVKTCADIEYLLRLGWTPTRNILV
jgi:nucleoside-diphosphate-sugar epimerase